MSALNFSKEEDGAAGYEQVNITGNPSKVTIVCGELFRKISSKPDALASILLEPANKILLEDFLQGIEEVNVLPWTVSAKLKHWASKRAIDESGASENTSTLPYLKTTQTLTSAGGLNDPTAIDLLTQRMQAHVQGLKENEPLNQAVHSLDTIVNYICDAEEDVNPCPSTRQRSIRQHYQNVLGEMKQARTDLQGATSGPMPAPAIPSTSAQLPPQEKLLHRIAGSDSLVGLAETNESQMNITSMVFPTN